MKKILILTYFFPPSNFAGSYRVASFAKYLHKYGYYPIVVTRQAPENAGTFREMAKDCGKDIIHEKHEGYEVYYLPYKGNLRDKIYAKYGDDKFVFLRKVLSFFELFFQGFTVRAIPYNNIYYFAKRYIKRNKDIDLVLCSGKPYQLFLFAHLLNKKFGVKWVADYRDEWNSWMVFNNIKLSLKHKFLYYYEVLLEKKWTSNASLITTVSDVWADHLSKFLMKQTKVVMNGYDNELVQSVIKKTKDIQENTLVLTHLGSFYENQPVEMFFNTITKLVKSGYKIKCYLPGATFETFDKDRLNKCIEGNETIFIVMPRIKQREAYEMLYNADALIMIGYQNFKGVLSSKVIEYLPWFKPILLAPSDSGVIEELLLPYSKTIICNTADKLKKEIINLFNNQYKHLEVLSDKKYVVHFSREMQVQNMAFFFNEINTK